MSEAAGWWNTQRPLTRSSDYGREGLAVKATRNARPRPTAAERLRAKVQQTPSGCLEYTGWRDGDGYGRIWFDGRSVPVHRLAWELVNGPIPDGLLACHRCDNPPCCNPGHLFLGTQSENIRDAVTKKRQRSASRTHCPEGHPYDEVNTYVRPSGSRKCRTCNRERERERQRRT